MLIPPSKIPTKDQTDKKFYQPPRDNPSHNTKTSKKHTNPPPSTHNQPRKAPPPLKHGQNIRIWETNPTTMTSGDNFTNDTNRECARKMQDSANSDTNRFPRSAFHYKARKKGSPPQCGTHAPRAKYTEGKLEFFPPRQKSDLEF